MRFDFGIFFKNINNNFCSSVDYFSRQTLRAPELWPYIRAKSKRESLMTIRESLRKNRLQALLHQNEMGIERRNSENFGKDELPNLVIETKQNNFLHQSHDTSIKKKQLNFSMKKQREMISIEDINNGNDEEGHDKKQYRKKNKILSMQFSTIDTNNEDKGLQKRFSKRLSGVNNDNFGEKQKENE